MKRKIEKFMAYKQGKCLGPEKSLPTGEEGYFDFMGDLEGVLLVPPSPPFDLVPTPRRAPYMLPGCLFAGSEQAVRARAPKGQRHQKLKKLKDPKPKKDKKKDPAKGDDLDDEFREDEDDDQDEEEDEEDEEDEDEEETELLPPKVHVEHVGFVVADFTDASAKKKKEVPATAYPSNS